LKIEALFKQAPYYIATVVLMPFLLIQAYWARFNALELPEALGERSGYSGTGSSVNILIIGDSAAAGVGVDEQKDALAGQLASILAIKHRVSWQLVASTGFTSADLIKKIKALPVQTFDYVLVSVGVNDTTHLNSATEWVSSIDIMTNLLATKFDDPKVLLTAIPPMHLFTGLPQPLRWWLGMRAKGLNKLMTISVEDKNQCSVLTVTSPLTPEYLADDGIHPSKLAYRVWAKQAAEALID